MKCIIFILFILSMTSLSQDFKERNDIRVYVGNVNSSLLNTNSISQNSLSAGLMYEWYLPLNFSITTGMFFSKKGFTEESLVISAPWLYNPPNDTDSPYYFFDINAEYYFLEVPIIIFYDFNVSNHIHLKLGTGFSWLINTSQEDKLENKYTIDVSNLTETEIENYPYDFIISLDPGDRSPASSTYDYLLSIQFEWFEYLFQIRYSQNFSGRVKTYSILNHKRQLKSWAIFLGYKF